MKFRFINLLQGSDEWLEWKQWKIGSSDAASILGLSPWETPLQCWERHMFDLKKPTSKAMARGLELEEVARKWINDKLKVNYEPKVIQNLDEYWIIASLDGHYEKDGEHHLLEIKCPGLDDHLDALSGNIPDHYYPQLQHQMMATGLDSMTYLSFDGKNGAIIEVKKDPEYCENLFLQEKDFLARLKDFKPPEVTDRDWVEIEDSRRSKTLSRIKEIRDIIEELEIERKDLETEVKEDLPHVRCKINGAKIQRISRPGAIDYSKIAILKEVNVDAYRKPPVVYWAISF